MSEYINNREYRQKALKELILELHDGKPFEEVKEKFEKLFGGVSANEIAALENELIKEGMPVSEVQRLCDVHAAIFKGSIEEIHSKEAYGKEAYGKEANSKEAQGKDAYGGEAQSKGRPEDTVGHPVHTMKMENREIKKLAEEVIAPLLDELDKKDGTDLRHKLAGEFIKLMEIDKHYLIKENLLFPFMEKYGITAPPKVMWGVDDEIRAAIRQVIEMLNDPAASSSDIAANARAAVDKVQEMIFKEENILIPMVLDTLSEDEWLKIAHESNEIGFTLYEPDREWKPVRVNVAEKEQKQGTMPAGEGWLQFETGIMTKQEIEAVLNTLPVDITFVDKDGVVKFFSQGTDRIFPRTKAVIGRKVQNCHPPASVHVVEQVVESLKSGEKDHVDFWIRMGDRYVMIRYLAVRDKDGEFLGTLEFTQDIAPLRQLEGEKRLLDEEKGVS